MQKQIKLRGKNVKYLLRTSKRARRMRLTIYRDNSFVVTRPMGLSEGAVEEFIIQKTKWVLSKLGRPKQLGMRLFKNNRNKYLTRKEDALKFTEERMEHFNKIYNFKFNKISIRNQRTRWGSCSKKGNLSFNYRILFLPNHIADYIVVHELCHLKELNHSKRFWGLVAKTMPNYLNIKKELRFIGL